ncbi:hypothetical protein LZ634_10120 [Kluyvera intermedia]|uniref:hypothetical protein n=1 Tax=Kluyvera intermedia TaxID=61648 RepID=UPI001F30AC26|nr:hypothetical protein [Kluyvera intermedia]MCE9889054.1 hypothetical protein [Kluyvera intermedia]
MTHFFFEHSQLDPGVKDVNDLNHVLRKPDENNAFVISSQVATFVTNAMIFDGPKLAFADCCFALNGAAEFVEFDADGNAIRYSEPVPDWYQTPAEFVSGEWLKTHGLDDTTAAEFIKEIKEGFPDLEQRRQHVGLMFDLQLETLNPVYADRNPVTKPGNTNRISTAPKVSDIGSFEIFAQMVARLREVVTDSTRLPTMLDLCGTDDITRTDVRLKASVRTWFKGITGELPPNNTRQAAIDKLIEAGSPEKAAQKVQLFCAPIRDRLQEIDSFGLETWYKALSEAITEAGDRNVSDFSFKL